MKIDHPDMRTCEGKGATKTCKGAFGPVHFHRPSVHVMGYVRTCKLCGYHLPVQKPDKKATRGRKKK